MSAVRPSLWDPGLPPQGSPSPKLHACNLESFTGAEKKGNNMVITEYRSDVEESLAIVETEPADALPEGRARDARGHCWDGLACDHIDHGESGTIHFMR